MIDVEMTLDTFGWGVKRTRLVYITIVNDGTGTAYRGNYNYKITGKKGRLMKTGRIENWPRTSKTAINLLQAVINNAYPNAHKNKPKE